MSSVLCHRLLHGNRALNIGIGYLSAARSCQLWDSLFEVRTCSISYSAIMAQKVITPENMNPQVIKMEYAVRGPLVIRATALEKELQAGAKKPFTEVTKANIGDAHAMGQKPITFIRQVIRKTCGLPVEEDQCILIEIIQVVSACLTPAILDDPSYPEDVKSRVRTILEGCKGSSLGSYSDSPGIEIIRRHVAQYIERRDGFPSSWEDIVLCAGASEGIRSVMKLFIKHVNGIKPGIMIPIPQYPLYSATIAEFDLEQVGYYLDEGNNWSLDIPELERAITEARQHCIPKVLVVINPGNPTGQVLTKKNIEDIIKFAYKEKLFVFADEVYQDNVYAEGSQFHSFKKVIMELGQPYSNMELASFMSCSKGYMGECGLRGGYGEVLNVDPEVKRIYLKMISAKLCPTTLGQAVIDCVTNPPQPGEPSYDRFILEKRGVLGSLANRAKMIADTFNSVPGMSCNVVQGAMYAFPQIKLPKKAIEAAAEVGQAADVFYAFQVLENTGICIIPGSGFGQRPGTYHFRTTILPQPDKLKLMLEKFREFHTKFIEKYQW